MLRKKLERSQIEEELATLEGWQSVKDGTAINKVFKFPNFIGAFGFMTKVALLAEAMDHHPDWTNIYRTVDITLNTHDAGGVTQLDIDLAMAIENLL